jgi:hypothetical protein
MNEWTPAALTKVLNNSMTLKMQSADLSIILGHSSKWHTTLYIAPINAVVYQVTKFSQWKKFGLLENMMRHGFKYSELSSEKYKCLPSTTRP